MSQVHRRALAQHESYRVLQTRAGIVTLSVGLGLSLIILTILVCSIHAMLGVSPMDSFRHVMPMAASIYAPICAARYFSDDGRSTNHLMGFIGLLGYCKAMHFYCSSTVAADTLIALYSFLLAIGRVCYCALAFTTVMNFVALQHRHLLFRGLLTLIVAVADIWFDLFGKPLLWQEVAMLVQFACWLFVLVVAAYCLLDAIRPQHHYPDFFVRGFFVVPAWCLVAYGTWQVILNAFGYVVPVSSAYWVLYLLNQCDIIAVLLFTGFLVLDWLQNRPWIPNSGQRSVLAFGTLYCGLAVSCCVRLYWFAGWNLEVWDAVDWFTVENVLVFLCGASLWAIVWLPYKCDLSVVNANPKLSMVAEQGRWRVMAYVLLEVRRAYSISHHAVHAERGWQCLM
jgi:hypothetical protein